MVVRQFLAACRKTALLKRRRRWTAFLEIFSPSLVLLALVIFFIFSDVDHYSAETYTQIDYALPQDLASPTADAGVDDASSYDFSDLGHIIDLLNQTLR